MKTKLKAIVNHIAYLIEDWQNEENGEWLQSYDDCADRQTLADLIAQDETRFHRILSDNFDNFDNLTDSNKDNFIDYLLDLGDWRAVYCSSLGNWGIQRPENVNLFFGQIGEHWEQIDGLERYSKLVQARFPDITISGNCIYYYCDGGIAFELQGDYQELWQNFVELNNHDNMEHFLSDSSGQYIPQEFIECIDLADWQGITAEDAEILKAGSESEFYWEAWDCVLNNASVKHKGIIWRLWQDGDLWLVTDNYIFED